MKEIINEQEIKEFNHYGSIFSLHFLSIFIFSTYKSTPNIVAAKRRSCAMKTLTLRSISPIGGSSTARAAKNIAAKNDAAAR